MKIKDKIILYFDEQLNENEKAAFEAELKNSSELQQEVQQYKKLLSLINETKNVEINSNYFDNIISLFRSKTAGEKKKKISPKTAYVFSIVSAVFLICYVLIGNLNVNNVRDEVYTNNYFRNGNSSILSNSYEELIPDDLSSNEKNDYDIRLGSIIETELNITSDSIKYSVADGILGYNTVIENISDTEADLVYNNILNKKIF